MRAPLIVHIPANIQYTYFFIDELLAREIAQELRSSSSLGSSPETGRTECDCLPACTSIQYEAELSQADFDWARLFMAFKANFSEMPK